MFSSAEAFHNELERTIEESGVSSNSFYSNPCSVKGVEYLKFLFISSGSPLVALERDIFKLTKGCLTLLRSPNSFPM